MPRKSCEDIVLNAQRYYSLEQENLLRHCLERWVSELEPIAVFRGLKFVGLGHADQADGRMKVHVRAPKVAKVVILGVIDDDDDT